MNLSITAELPPCLRPGAQGKFVAAALDTETTGLSAAQDQIIELGLRLFEFELPSGRIVRELESFSQLQDPGFEISPEIQRVTGITPLMLAGHAIDWASADALLARAELLIAHNAQFDRGFVDRKSRVTPGQVWCCTAWQIEWRAKGFRNARLQDLAAALGISHVAHRAMGDVEAMLGLLARTDELTGAPYLRELLATAARPVVYAWVEGNTYDYREALKAHGYRWDSAGKIWGKTLPADEVGKLGQTLETLAPGVPLALRTREIPIRERFKANTV